MTGDGLAFSHAINLYVLSIHILFFIFMLNLMELCTCFKMFETFETSPLEDLQRQLSLNSTGVKKQTYQLWLEVYDVAQDLIQ